MSSRTSADDQRREYVFKVLVIGEMGTGKTAIVKRSSQNSFTEHYKATVGVDFALKITKANDGTIVRVQLWDIGGQERFGDMTRVYYKDAVGCIVVFDLTRASTFEAVAKWKADLDRKVQLPNGNRLPSILLANKCDLVKDSVPTSPEQMNNYCGEHGFDKWFETSAKTNVNIEASIQYLLNEIMKQNDNSRSRPRREDLDKPIILSESKSKEKEAGGGGCCGSGGGKS